MTLERAAIALLHAATDLAAALLHLSGLSAQQVLTILGLLALYPLAIGLYAVRGRANVRVIWQRLHGLPLGWWLFRRILHLSSPHSLSVPCEVRDISGRGVHLVMRASTSTYNIYRTVSYGALVSLAELAAVLQVMGQAEPGQRAVPKAVQVERLGRLRGNVHALCTHRRAGPSTGVYTEQVPVQLLGGEGESLARVTFTFVFGERDS